MAKVAYSAEIEEMRGKLGNAVFSQVRSGPTVRTRVAGRNPRSNAQTAARSNFAKAAIAYKNLTPAQVASWTIYANSQTRHNRLTGRAYTPTANTVFVGLASKFLQITPTGTIPVTPPAAAFFGDSVALTAAGVAGGVTFTSTGANAANVKTELLVQPLKSRNRTPSETGYRTKAIVMFVSGTLTSNIALPPGFYAPAYRFVNVPTGQETPLVTLPIIQVT